MALAAAPAQAKKGWGFKETFGAANQPEFGEARKMAVDRSSGDLLVYDNSNRTISRWQADGTPANFTALGTNVIDGKRTGATNECPAVPADCDETPGNAGIASIFLDQVAVDNSGTATDGNIYVTHERSPSRVDIFSAEGGFLGQLTEAGASGSFAGITGVGVDEAGDVYVKEFGEVQKFEPSANPPVNGDHVATLPAIGRGTIALGAGPTDGFLFFTTNSFPGVSKIDSTTGTEQYRFAQSLGFQPELTLDPATGHVFAGSGKQAIEFDASGGTEAIQVARLEEAGITIRGLAVAEGAEQLYLARGGTEKVEVYESGPVSTPVTGPPDAVSGAKATVTGTVNPEGAEVVECLFDYGKTTSYGQQAPCDEYESEPDKWEKLLSTDELGTGNDPVPVRGELTGMLANGVTYHYRLAVVNEIGTEAVKTAAGDQTLITDDTYTTDSASGITEAAAILNGTVKLEGVELTDCRFEWGETTDYGQEEDCEPHFSTIAADDEDHAVSASLGDLEPSTVYHFRLVAENAAGQIVAKDRTFITQGPPVIVEQRPLDVTRTGATLQARINPAGLSTTYHFQFRAEGSPYGPPEDESDALAGGEPVVVSREIAGLQERSLYFFRVVATNSKGTTVGPDQRLETLNQHGLPNDRAFELITPVDKGAAGAVAIGFTQQLEFQASEDGESFLWPLQNGIEDSTAGGWTRWRAERTGSGWLSAQVSAPSLIPPPTISSFGFIDPSLVLHASPDLSCGVLQTYNPITDDTPELSVDLGVESLYLWRAEGGEIRYELITDRVPLNPEAKSPNGRLYNQIEAAEDCSRVYFKTVYELIAGASGLYEWDEGTLRDAGVRPDGSVGGSLGLGAGAAVPGGEVNAKQTARWHAASRDGRRFFFTAIANEGPSAGKPAIFMRSDGGAAVVEISRSETAVATNGARYEAASPDGSRVLFRANYGIDAQASSAGPTDATCGPLSGETSTDANPPIEAKACDLYAYDTETGELTDLSADTAGPTGAQAQGTVAVDSDGSHVYFAALGRLVPGEGRSYAQNLAGTGSANVYLWAEGALSYVTTLERVNRTVPGQSGRTTGDLHGGSSEGGNGALMRRPTRWSAHASADGGALAFEAAGKLTDYESGGGKAVYLYSAETGKVTCLSCPADGSPTLVSPSGRVDQRPDSPRLLPWRTSEHIGYAPRAVSADGRRVYFTSPDALATGAAEGKRNVYQWQQGQVSFLAVAERPGQEGFIPELGRYLDVSASGDDVFIATQEPLAPQDRDSIADVYAVRVEGGFPVPPQLPECQVDEGVPLEPNQIYCQGDPSPPPAAAAPGSAGPSAGNLPPPGPDCNRFARQAKRLSQRAKRLGRAARKAQRRGQRRAAVRLKGKSRRLGKRAKRRSKAAKRCRSGTRPANRNRGGVR